MLVKIIFHGALKKICPDVYEADASTPAEAIRGITNQFRNKLIRKDGQRFVCSVKECPKDVDLNSCIRTEELNIYPSFYASGGGGNKPGMIQTVIGSVLIVVGAALWYFTGGTAAAIGTWMMKVGAAMVLTGAATMLFGPNVDTANSSENPESSKAFGNSGNTTKIGTRIPIGYGKYKVAGQYLSINTSAITTKGGAAVTTTIFGIGKKVIRESTGVES